MERERKQILKCTEAVWAIWLREYVQSLRETHCEKSKGGPIPSFEDVVMKKGRKVGLLETTS